MSVGVTELPGERDVRLFDPHYFGRQKVLRQSEMRKLFIGQLENDLGMQTSINQSR